MTSSSLPSAPIPLSQPLIRLTPPPKAHTVMAAPQRLQNAIEFYLNTTSHAEKPPTFEGLSLAAGFTSFQSAKKAILNPSHPKPSRDSLIMALSHIADTYQQGALLRKLDPAFAKYLLSAYLNISEKTVQESTVDTAITIRWANPNDQGDHVKIDPTNRPAQSKIEEASHTSLEQELRELEAADQPLTESIEDLL